MHTSYAKNGLEANCVCLEGIEPSTSVLSGQRSTTELQTRSIEKTITKREEQSKSSLLFCPNAFVIS